MALLGIARCAYKRRYYRLIDRLLCCVFFCLFLCYILFVLCFAFVLCLLIVCCVFSVYTMQLMLEVKRHIEKNYPGQSNKELNYTKMGHVALGTFGKWAVNIAVLGCNLGVCAGYMIFISTNLQVTFFNTYSEFQALFSLSLSLSVCVQLHLCAHRRQCLPEHVGSLRHPPAHLDLPHLPPFLPLSSLCCLHRLSLPRGGNDSTLTCDHSFFLVTNCSFT